MSDKRRDVEAERGELDFDEDAVRRELRERGLAEHLIPDAIERKRGDAADRREIAATWEAASEVVRSEYEHVYKDIRVAARQLSLDRKRGRHVPRHPSVHIRQNAWDAW